MRITFLTPPPNLSGGIRVIAQRADWLRSRGHEVRIVHQRPRAFGRRGLRNWWADGKALFRPPHPTHFDALEVERILVPSGRAPVDADLPDADVVIATWWETAEWMAGLSARKGVKAYFVQGHEVFDHLPKDRVRATYRLPVSIVTVSEWLRTILREEYGAQDVSLVPNGVDLDHFRAPARSRQERPTVGMVYSSDRMKGCDVSLAAIEIASRQLPGLRFVTFGPDPSPHQALPLPRCAEYVAHPPQQLIPSLYASCDAWLFGSRSEGFGLPLLEAMACRTPVVATPAGAAPELTREGGGLQVPSEDPRGMAEAIVHLCRCPEPEWSRRSRLAWETAQRHSLERTHRMFEDVLLHLAAGRASTRHAPDRARPVPGRGERQSPAFP